MMEIIRREIEARERSMGVLPSQTRKSSTKPPTSLSLTTGAATQASCAYCSQPHPSSSCQVIMRLEERKQALRTSGHCFVCLRRNHISWNCRSSARCLSTVGGTISVYVPTLVVRSPIQGVLQLDTPRWLQPEHPTFLPHLQCA